MNKMLLILTTATFSLGALAQQADMTQARDEAKPVTTETGTESKREARDPFDASTAYNEMEKSHMDDWLDLTRQYHNDKYALIKKHHDEKADFHHRGLQKLKESGFSKDMLRTKLEDMIKLHEQQVEEWHDLCENHSKQGKMFYEKHKRELEDFKRSL